MSLRRVNKFIILACLFVPVSLVWFQWTKSPDNRLTSIGTLSFENGYITFFIDPSKYINKETVQGKLAITNTNDKAWKYSNKNLQCKIQGKMISPITSRWASVDVDVNSKEIRPHTTETISVMWIITEKLQDSVSIDSCKFDINEK
jgi:hypothetical protein